MTSLEIFNLLGDVFNPANLQEEAENIQAMQDEEYIPYEDVTEYERIKQLNAR